MIVPFVLNSYLINEALKEESILRRCSFEKWFASIEKHEIRNFICRLEEKIRQMPDCKTADDYPTEHRFSNGQYIRQLFAPKGDLIITKIHKFSHPVFILSGECSVLSEDGLIRVKAPCYMITPEGTKRAVYVHEDTVWVTVHRTDNENIKEIEDEIYAKNFDEYENIIPITGETKCQEQQ